MPVDHPVPVGLNVKGALQDVVVPVSVKDVTDLVANVKVITACVTRHVVQSPVVLVSQLCDVCSLLWPLARSLFFYRAFIYRAFIACSISALRIKRIWACSNTKLFLTPEVLNSLALFV